MKHEKDPRLMRATRGITTETGATGDRDAQGTVSRGSRCHFRCNQIPCGRGDRLGHGKTLETGERQASEQSIEMLWLPENMTIQDGEGFEARVAEQQTAVGHRDDGISEGNDFSFEPCKSGMKSGRGHEVGAVDGFEGVMPRAAIRP
jgi:hypothetical protein